MFSSSCSIAVSLITIDGIKLTFCAAFQLQIIIGASNMLISCFFVVAIKNKTLWPYIHHFSVKVSSSFSIVSLFDMKNECKNISFIQKALFFRIQFLPVFFPGFISCIIKQAIFAIQNIEIGCLHAFLNLLIDNTKRLAMDSARRNMLLRQKLFSERTNRIYFTSAIYN